MSPQVLRTQKKRSFYFYMFLFLSTPIFLDLRHRRYQFEIKPWYYTFNVLYHKGCHNTTVSMIYGSDIWVVNEKKRSKITSTEMECLRKRCRVTRTDEIRNDEIIRTGVDKELLSYIGENLLIWYERVGRENKTDGYKVNQNETGGSGRSARGLNDGQMDN